MPPDKFKFGGGLDQTLLHPLVLVTLLVAIVLIVVLKRKYVIAPVLLVAFLVPLAQQVVVSGIHVYVFRIVILAGLLRMFFSRQPSPRGRLGGGFGTFDQLFVAWALVRALTFVALFQQMGALVNQFGFLLDTLGAFFLLRFLIQGEKDIQSAIQVLALVAVIVSAGMLTEHFGNLNVFGLVGGVRVVPEIRNEFSLRAQGPFGHPLLAGAFGATSLPLFFWLWKRGQSRTAAAVGMISSTIITVTAASSTPILAYAAGVGAACFWAFRTRMRLVRWGIVAALVGLHLVMKAPVWFLIAHIDVVGGSSADHRAHLVDLFIRNIGDWWLVGTDNNANWGWSMWDTANQYVEEGFRGGLASFLCFVGLIALAFKKLGAARKAVAGNRTKEWGPWLLGSALFAHVVGFFGISYFDQTRMAWFTLLAIICAATAPVRHKKLAAKTADAETLPHPSPAYASPASSGSAGHQWLYLREEELMSSPSSRTAGS